MSKNSSRAGNKNFSLTLQGIYILGQITDAIEIMGSTFFRVAETFVDQLKLMLPSFGALLFVFRRLE